MDNVILIAYKHFYQGLVAYCLGGWKESANLPILPLHYSLDLPLLHHSEFLSALHMWRWQIEAPTRAMGSLSADSCEGRLTIRWTLGRWYTGMILI